MKSVSRNRFFLCFKPVVEDEDMSIQNSEETIKNSVSDPGCPETARNSVIQRPRNRKSFLQMIKFAVFENFLAKRVRHRKSLNQDSYRSKCGIYSKSSKVSFENKIEETNSEPCSGFSTLGISLQSKPEKQNPENRTQESADNSKTENTIEHVIDFNSFIKYLILISLMITILWGKLFAIAFTSICLYLIPHLRPAAHSDGFEVQRDNDEETEQKKITVMEGQLERNREATSRNREYLRPDLQV